MFGDRGVRPGDSPVDTLSRVKRFHGENALGIGNRGVSGNHLVPAEGSAVIEWARSYNGLDTFL